MPMGTVRIEELLLRVPGGRAADARRLGEDVARRVAEALPADGREERLGALELRVRVPFGAAQDRLAGEIARAILAGLR
jgi:hypothetical protein